MRRYTRKGRDGAIFYYADFSLEGKRRRLSLGPNKKVADALAKDLELKLMRSQLKIPEKKKVNIEDWISEYLIYSQKEKAESTYQRDLGHVDSLGCYLKENSIENLSQVDFMLLNRYKLLLSQKWKRKTVNNYLCIIRTMFKFAVEHGMLDQDPSTGLNLFKKVPRKHPRILTSEEIEKVLSSASPLMRKVISILLLTGLRASEFINLRRSQIDIDQGTIRIECSEGFHTKNYEPRTISFLPGLKEILLSLPDEGVYLFDNKQGSPLFTPDMLYRWTKRIYKKCGIKDANVHSLRHTFGTNLIMNGIDVPTVQKLMGHKRIETTMKYCHIPQEHIRESLLRVDFRVPHLCQPGQANTS